MTDTTPDLVAELERAGSSIGVYKDIAALLLRAAAELREAKAERGALRDALLAVLGAALERQAGEGEG